MYCTMSRRTGVRFYNTHFVGRRLLREPPTLTQAEFCYTRAAFAEINEDIATRGSDMSAEAKIKELNLVLPTAPKPAGVYKPVVLVDKLAYVSGHGPLKPDGSMITGRVGADLDEKGGFDAARQVGLAI